MTESFSFRDPSGECPMRSWSLPSDPKNVATSPRSRPKSRVRNLEPSFRSWRRPQLTKDDSRLQEKTSREKTRFHKGLRALAVSMPDDPTKRKGTKRSCGQNAKGRQWQKDGSGSEEIRQMLLLQWQCSRHAGWRKNWRSRDNVRNCSSSAKYRKNPNHTRNQEWANGWRYCTACVSYWTRWAILVCVLSRQSPCLRKTLRSSQLWGSDWNWRSWRWWQLQKVWGTPPKGVHKLSYKGLFRHANSCPQAILRRIRSLLCTQKLQTPRRLQMGRSILAPVLLIPRLSIRCTRLSWPHQRSSFQISNIKNTRSKKNLATTMKEG